MIARLLPADAAEYRALMLDAYAQHPEAFTSSHAERAALPLAWWQARLAAQTNAAEIVLGARRDGVIAGVAGVAFERREKARHKATLFGMYVPPAHRQHGLGRALVTAAIAQAEARDGVLVMQLTVSENNDDAQRLYAACGFVPFGVEPFAVAVGEDFVSKVHMWRRLAPARTSA